MFLRSPFISTQILFHSPDLIQIKKKLDGHKKMYLPSSRTKNSSTNGRTDVSGVDKLTQLVAPFKEEAFEVQLWSGEHGWGRTRVPHQVGISIGHPKKVVNSKGIRTPKMAETFRNCLDNQWLVVG